MSSQGKSVLSLLMRVRSKLFSHRQSEDGELNIKEANFALIAEALDLGREPVVFVSSYPRSGNTWVRRLLTDVWLQGRGFETATKLPVHPDKIIPGIGPNSLLERGEGVAPPGIFVKTHEAFHRLKAELAGSDFDRGKHLYVYRSPEDALVSYYHFHLRYEHLREQAAAGVDDFCLSRLPDWEEHVRSYLEAREKGYRLLFVSYELLHADPVFALAHVTDWLGWVVDSSCLEQAVSHAQFEKLRELEAKDPINEEEYFFRKGEVGSARDDLRPATIEAIRKRATPLIDKANALLPRP